MCTQQIVGATLLPRNAAGRDEGNGGSLGRGEPLWHSSGMTFTVLFVCTGNVCRSPVAERLLRARAGSAPVMVNSAGMGALVGEGIDGPSALALRELGVDADGHVARQLTAALAGTADLILTAELAHRSAVVQADPLSFRRTFTMREFARLGAELGPLAGPVTEAALRGRVADVADRRGWSDPPEPGVDDIGDPYRASMEVARACVAELADAVAGISGALGLAEAAVN